MEPMESLTLLPASRTPPPPVQTGPSQAAELMRTCANCGSRMEVRKCKLICTSCGYFLSCADYY
jgi:hypothetical protein